MQGRLYGARATAQFFDRLSVVKADAKIFKSRATRRRATSSSEARGREIQSVKVNLNVVAPHGSG